MATPEQKAASRKVMDAVTALNEAGSEGLHVKLDAVTEIGRRNPTYVVAEIETRETVPP
ncbi:hypothetical protein [Bradyrhizobium sp. USDA 4529]